MATDPSAILLQRGQPAVVRLTSAAVDQGASQIARWLRSADIQATGDGPERGGIAGVVGADGQRGYIYGEITGYWLSWASRRATCPDRMGAAVAFLARQCSPAEPPPTRHGLSGDWRNGAVFSFDLAMMLRGLADAAPVVGEAPCRAAAMRLVPWLVRMISAEGTLLACLPHRKVPLPMRWSTRPGPYQCKTAAAILHAPEAWCGADLRGAARRTLDRWTRRALEHQELHPLFYALEGELAAGCALPAVSPVVAALRRGQAWPEQRCEGAPRADVQAQALRLLCIDPAPDATALEAAAAALLAHLAPDGSMHLRVDDAQANVWSAMFAEQALEWLARRRASGQVPEAQEIV